MNWNRRNTSEISIYNYPEHLNPFYENENHKRLRFWNFKKEGNNKGRSFSIGNLKNMWSYSFSPKKSSTLGINKTSESPPILRKNVNNNIRKMRENDLDGSYRNLNSFCEEFHRRSLQHIDTPKNSDLNVFFNRNNDYRRTTQFSGYSSTNKLTRSSQSSLTSNNPFECEVNKDFNIPKTYKRYRKKRRAPQPPSPLQNDYDLDKETDVSINNDGGVDIKSLANEIELFVNERSESPINYDAKKEKKNNLVKQNIENRSLALLESDTVVNSSAPGFVGNTLTAYIKNQPKTVHPYGTLNCTEDIKENDLATKDLDVQTTQYSNKTKKNENEFEDNPNPNIITKLHQLHDHPMSKTINRIDNYYKSNTCKPNHTSMSSEETYNLQNLLKKFESNEPVSYSKNDFYDISQTPTLNNHKSNQLSLRKSINKAIESISRNQQLLNDTAAKGTKSRLTSLYQNDETKYFYANELNSQNVRCSDPESKHMSMLNSNTDDILSKTQNNNIYKTKILKTTVKYRESSPTSSNLDWNPLPKPKRTSNKEE